jgi:hypothetical protein
VIRAAVVAAAIIVFTFYLRWQTRSQEESPEAIKKRVSQLEPELRKQVQARSYGARRQLIEAPLRELDLDITPRLGWVRDPRLTKPDPNSQQTSDDIVATFESSKRRMLIVGEPGSGKTMAAYSLIEYLDETEGDERTPLLVNLSAWEAQDDFGAFLVDYLCSSVGYEVHERAVARAFIDSGQYNLILDGLDEMPLRLRRHFSERLDDFLRGLASEVGVVVTCRTREYEEILAAHPIGLGLVQAVEILPLSSEQLDSAFVELAKVDEDWETFLSQRDHTAYKRVRDLLSNPLFLNLAVVGHLSPGQLLDWSTTEQELRDLVLDRYLDRTLAEQRNYKAEDVRHYLTWIARFLNGDEISPFGLKTTDYTVFDLADLTPPDPPRRYGLFGGLVVGLGIGLGFGVISAPAFGQGFAGGSGWGVALAAGLFFALAAGLFYALVYGLVFGLVRGPFARTAVSSHLTLVWPSTGRKLRDFLRRAVRGLGLVLMVGLIFGLFIGLLLGLVTYGVLYAEDGSSIPWFEVDGEPLRLGRPIEGLAVGLAFGLSFGLGVGLILGLFMGLGSGLLDARSELITSQSPRGTRSRSRVAALTWLLSGLVGGVVVELAIAQVFGGEGGIGTGVGLGVGLGALFALRNGGWFLLLQRTAHRRLAEAGNLPARPYDFLEWGIEQQIFRRVGGGVRFHHNLIQQHLGKEPQPQPHEAEARSETRGPKLALAGVFVVLAAVNIVLVGLAVNDLGVALAWAIHDLLRLAVTMVVASGVAYLLLRRRQGVDFREIIFNWPMFSVAAVVALVLFMYWPVFWSLNELR